MIGLTADLIFFLVVNSYTGLFLSLLMFLPEKYPTLSIKGFDVGKLVLIASSILWDTCSYKSGTPVPRYTLKSLFSPSIKNPPLANNSSWLKPPTVKPASKRVSIGPLLTPSTSPIREASNVSCPGVFLAVK